MSEIITSGLAGAIDLSKSAEVYHDEHGYHPRRGDYLTTKPLDYVPAPESMRPPYWDFGGRGCGVVEVTRKRVYGGRSIRRCGYCTTRYLVGRNETGSYYAHPVGKCCSSVREAVEWIWGGKTVLARQGDIALVEGVRGQLHDDFPPGVPLLPAGHRVEGGYIVHDTHPPLMLPRAGQRVVIGRRAKVYASEATRD